MKFLFENGEKIRLLAILLYQLGCWVLPMMHLKKQHMQKILEGQHVEINHDILQSRFLSFSFSLPLTLFLSLSHAFFQTEKLIDIWGKYFPLKRQSELDNIPNNI